MKYPFARPLTLACLAGIAVLSAAGLSAGELKLDQTMKIEKAIPDAPAVKPEKQHKVLVYTRASGFVHSSIPIGAKAFEMMGKKTGAYEVTKITEDPAVFDGDGLKEFDCIVLMSTTGDFLKPSAPRMDKKELDKMTEEQRKKAEEAHAKWEADNKGFAEAEPARKKALLDFVSSGKGLVGIHAATDAYYKWDDYGAMIGGYFNGHPWQKINVKIDDANSPLTAQFEGKNFDFVDEIYTYKTLPNHGRDKLHVLLSIDLEKSGFGKDDKDPAKYKGENRADHDYAVAWIKKHGSGRVFYTLLGHREETYMNPLSMKFFLAGMQYALGDLKADDTPSKGTASK
jgi:type 1 glutamine amidotransferase